MRPKHPKLEEWDLPSDADMIDWIEHKGVTVTSFYLLGKVCWDIGGCDPVTRQNVQLAVGDALRETLIQAMRDHP